MDCTSFLFRIPLRHKKRKYEQNGIVYLFTLLFIGYGSS